MLQGGRSRGYQAEGELIYPTGAQHFLSCAPSVCHVGQCKPLTGTCADQLNLAHAVTGSLQEGPLARG